MPADPQHPAEEAVDALRGAIRAVCPEGRALPNRFHQFHYQGGVYR